MFSVNEEAAKIVRRMISEAEPLNIKVVKLDNGATILDCGISAAGGWLAGKYFVAATIAGLGEVTFGSSQLGELVLPTIDVYVDRPGIACLSSQFSGWRIPGIKYNTLAPLGSGPARAIAQNDKFCKPVPYVDRNHQVVWAIQTTVLPDVAMTDSVAAACGISPEDLYVLAAATGSFAGAMQVVARNVEPAMWRVASKGFDPNKVICGYGSSPLPPIVRDELKAMDRVNTSLLYGTSVLLYVDCTDAEVEAVIDQLPLSGSRLYGEEFIDIFERGNRDFYEIDKDVHTVARFTMNNVATGRTFSAGTIRPDLLEKCFSR